MFPLAHPVPKVSIRDRPNARVSPDSWISMTLNILAAVGLCAAHAIFVFLTVPAQLWAQTTCPPKAVAVLDSGWVAYRADSHSVAALGFEVAQRLFPDNVDAKVGLGFALLRLGQAGRADSMFRVVLTRTA